MLFLIIFAIFAKETVSSQKSKTTAKYQKLNN